MKKVSQTLFLCLLPLFFCCSQGGSDDVLPPPEPTPQPDTTSVDKPKVDNPGVTIRDWDNDGKDYGGTAE